jgi:poly [ADP-ribose] polymerase
MKKVIVQGLAPVDAHFTKLDKSRVVEKDGVVYSATLNQSNVVKNNNKFYVMQIL